MLLRPTSGCCEHRTRAERRRQAEVIRTALALSRSAAQLMLPVARRRLVREQRHGGLVVVRALYGEEAAVLHAAEGAPQRWQQASAAAAAAAASGTASEQQPQMAQQAAGALQQQDEQRQQPPQQVWASPFEQWEAAAISDSDDVPPAVADVTVAVQYMVDSGKVVFHKGAPLAWPAAAAHLIVALGKLHAA